MTDSSTSPSVRMPPGYGNTRNINNTGDPSEASRLLDGCHQIMIAMSSPAIFENSKEKAFQTFRRGCLDLKKDISATEGLDSDKIDDWMIENCWLFLFELAKSRLRRKHILECMEILCTSDRWKKVLDNNDRVRAKLGELDDSFIQNVISEFHIKPLPPKPQQQSTKVKSNMGNRRSNRNKWETGSAVATGSKPPATPAVLTNTTSSLNRTRSASLGSLNINNDINEIGKIGDNEGARDGNHHPDTQSSHGSWSIEEVDDDDDAGGALLNNNNNNEGYSNTDPIKRNDKEERNKPNLNKKTSVIIIDKSNRSRSGTFSSSKHDDDINDSIQDISSPTAATATAGGGIASPIGVDSSIIDTNPFRNPKLFEDNDDNIIRDDDNITVDEWWNTPSSSSSSKIDIQHNIAKDDNVEEEEERKDTTKGMNDYNNRVEIGALQKQQEMIIKQQEELMKAIQLLSMDDGAVNGGSYNRMY